MKLSFKVYPDWDENSLSELSDISDVLTQDQLDGIMNQEM